MNRNHRRTKRRAGTRSVAGSKRGLQRVREESAFLADSPIEFDFLNRVGAQAADLCAEQRGFHGEADFRHWLETEAEGDSILMH